MKLSFEQVFSLPEFTIEYYGDLKQAKLVSNFYLNRLTSIILFHNDNYLNRKDMLVSETDEFNRLYTSNDIHLKEKTDSTWNERKLETKFDIIRELSRPPFPIIIKNQEELDSVQYFVNSGLSVRGFFPTDLSGISILTLNYVHIGDEGAKILAKDLLERRKDVGLSMLGLSYCEIGPDGAIALAESLKKNYTLFELKLDNNKIGTEGAKAIAESLKFNSKISEMSLAYCGIGEGIKEFGDTLKKNSTLIILNLTGNFIRSEDIIPIAESSKINKTLQTLILDYNSIGNDGIVSLAQALKHNSTLTHLSLTANNMSFEGAKEMAEMLRINSSLKNLTVDSNPINKEGKDLLVKAGGRRVITKL